MTQPPVKVIQEEMSTHGIHFLAKSLWFQAFSLFVRNILISIAFLFQLSKKYNLADPVDPNYPVIFNIILWMSILIAVSVLAVSCGLWNMDPGRDSIIYRMTSQRIKKE